MDKIYLSDAARVMGGVMPHCDGYAVGVCIDTRKLVPGNLFFAIKGDNFDGHIFVNKALEEGAVAAVCSHPVEDAKGVIIMVEDTRKALLDLAAYNRDLYDIPVVGLTGSVGKTTTKDMVAAVLASKYNTLATEANLNNDIGMPQMCMRIGSEHEVAVLEMGMNHFGEISLLTRIAKPTIGLITNVGTSHIENLGSREGILRAKLEILEGMSEDAPLVLCGDNDMLLAAAPGITGRRVILYGIDNENADCRAYDIREGSSSTTFRLRFEDDDVEITIPVVGRHNVCNACAAFVCGRLLGVSPEQAIEGLRTYVPNDRRQKIVEKKGFTFIEDCYNANPDSVKAALAVLRDRPGTGRRIAVLGDMLELGEYARRAHTECGEAARECGVDILLTYGPNAMFYIEGAGEGVCCKHYDDKSAIAHDLAKELREGDAVLFKASRGMKLEEVYEQLYKEL